jgi:hypothetical protein
MSVNDYDAELFEAIEDLVAEGEIEEGSPAHGIARKRREASTVIVLADSSEWGG